MLFCCDVGESGLELKVTQWGAYKSSKIRVLKSENAVLYSKVLYHVFCKSAKNISKYSPAMVAWFVKASVFHSVKKKKVNTPLWPLLFYNFFKHFENICKAPLSGLSWRPEIYKPEDFRGGAFSIRRIEAFLNPPK